MELVRNERFYGNLHMQLVGPVHMALKNISKNFSYSESYEIHALCNVLECNIRSFCPAIDLHPNILAMLNQIFSPMPPKVPKCTIAILWSHTMIEMDVKKINRGSWSPNHFVPLLSNGRNALSDEGASSPSMKVPHVRRYFK